MDLILQDGILLTYLIIGQTTLHSICFIIHVFIKLAIMRSLRLTTYRVRYFIRHDF